MEPKYSTTDNDDKSQIERLNKDKVAKKEASKTSNTKDNAAPTDLIDDLNKKKIDPLTEGATNLGYKEKSPRKKELEQKEHLDREDK